MLPMREALLYLSFLKPPSPSPLSWTGRHLRWSFPLLFPFLPQDKAHIQHFLRAVLSWILGDS